MATWNEIDQRALKKLIEATASDWALGSGVAKRCVPRAAMGGCIRKTIFSRSERSRRTKGGGRRATTGQDCPCKEFRRWNDHRSSDTRLGQGR